MLIYVESDSGVKSSYCTVTVTKPASKVILRDSLPFTINEYDRKGVLESSCRITDFSYTAEERYNGEITIKLYFSGTKTYDEDGDKQSSSCKIGWKLYDEEGNVADSGVCYTTALSTGESFKDERVYCSNMSPGTYYLKFIDVN